MYMYVIVIVYNPCLSHPCQHGGECINSTEGFVCKCKGNHNGTICSGRFYVVAVSAYHTFLRKTSTRVLQVTYTNIPTEMHMASMKLL